MSPFWNAAKSMEWARSALRSVEPRVHGNGFIQIDLTPQHRLHIWGHPDIPRQKVDTSVHDHVFNFYSLVLVGSITNTIYGLHRTLARNARYGTYTAHCRHGQDTVLQPDHGGRTYNLSHTSQTTYVPGDVYHMPRLVLHSTLVYDPAATLIVKRPTNSPVLPRVMVRVDQEPDNDFDRHVFDKGELMRITREVLGI